MTEPNEDWLPLITDDDRDRIARNLRTIGGEHVSWGAQSILDVWLAEHRVAAERRSSAALARATWALGAVTLMLVLATVGLIVATLA